MRLEAMPVQFLALSDGVLDGEEHILIFLGRAEPCRPRGFALSLADARALRVALDNILPQAQQIQERIRESN